MLNLESVGAPAGEMEIVLDQAAGVMLHEAVGHGLKVISTERAHLCFLAALASRSPLKGSLWLMMAPFRTARVNHYR